jgi:O-antigen ligase
LIISIEKFSILVLTLFSFLGSTHFIVNFLNMSTPLYFFQILISSIMLLVIIQQRKLEIIWERIILLKYFFVFFFLNMFIQFFYHNLSIGNELIVIGYFVSFFTNVLVMSFLFESKDVFNFFIKISKGILYIILFFGIINSFNLINSNLFFTGSKLIDNYNFLFLKNTGSLLEHQISYGLTVAILFSTLLFKDKFLSILLKLPIVILGIFVSFSRTAWLSMLIAFIFSYSKAKNIIFLALTIFLIINIIPNEFFYNIFRLESLGSGREVTWIYALEMLRDNFLFGFGFASYFDIKNVFLTDFELGLFEFSSTDHLHNSYLTLIFESGIIVATIYIFAIIEQFIYSPKKYRNIFIYILFVFLIGSFFVEFRLGGLRFFNFFFTAIIAYLLSIRSGRFFQVE